MGAEEARDLDREMSDATGSAVNATPTALRNSEVLRCAGLLSSRRLSSQAISA